MEEERACPCLYLKTPCHERCTCVDGWSSSGCRNCCTYGSIEQRQIMAERLNEYRLFFIENHKIKIPIEEAKAPVEEVKYGDYVQMDDRFETVHIWTKELEDRNAGRWIPQKITKEKYEEEKAKNQNK